MRRILLLATVLSACSSDDVTGPQLSIRDLAGTWMGTGWRWISAVDSAQRHNVLPVGGGAFLAISAAGSFTFTVLWPDSLIVAESGTLTVSGDTLTYTVAAIFVDPRLATVAETRTRNISGDTSTNPGEEIRFVVVLTGDTMLWRALETELHDLDDDGVPEETIEERVFARR